MRIRLACSGEIQMAGIPAADAARFSSTRNASSPAVRSAR
jgi:hypothetical protein